MPSLAVELRNITKTFPSAIANDNVSLGVMNGEIHAIIGENGAGKTTMMNILYGLCHPDSGKIFVNGRRVKMDAPKIAIKQGIGMVHQHFMLIPKFTVAENIILGREPGVGPFLNIKKAVKTVDEISDKYGFNLKPGEKIKNLPVGVAQRVEIVKVLYRGAKIIILDEPTSVLTPQEVDELFKILKTLKEKGHTIIFISHKLKEVLKIADRITVMRRGVVVGVRHVGETDEVELSKMMIGRAVKPEKKKENTGEPLLELQYYKRQREINPTDEVELSRLEAREIPRAEKEKGKTLLRLRNVSMVNEKGVEVLKNISLEVREGEILGVAGVQGNGQTELMEAVWGLRKIMSGEIYYESKKISGLTPREIADLGISYIPQDRHKHGLVLDYSVELNMIMGQHYENKFSNRWIMKYKIISDNARRLIKKYDIRPGDPKTPAFTLSGGNQQKVIVARELNRKPKLILASNPTRGVDIGAVEEIHKKLVEEKIAAKGIMLVSSELSEIMALSDRIIVMYEGEIVGETTPWQADEKTLGLMMAGVRE